MDKVIGVVLGIIFGLGTVVGIDWLVWAGYEWVTPLAWHVTNFWQFFVILILIGVVVSWLKSIFAPKKVED